MVDTTLHARVGGFLMMPVAATVVPASGVALRHETPFGRAALGPETATVAEVRRPTVYDGGDEGSGGGRFFTLNLKLNDSARGVGNM
ncbi:histidine kinase, HAMP region: chemotaxis sensory transducer [Anopheles sinensis]|uniref:Histidine kinase, HAMP region: chemotaxis sensory transducer n=1 Tax=Anopheles sinensis TaxID=74873 RepID=A0A084WD95_ANOSI|nr:histidine kinase, HAMP region: chemotaxis sensory transducer [Anopheles sinensis]